MKEDGILSALQNKEKLEAFYLKTLEKWPDEVYEIFSEDDIPDLEFNIKTML